jgi:hypothetical protein
LSTLNLNPDYKFYNLILFIISTLFFINISYPKLLIILYWFKHSMFLIPLFILIKPKLLNQQKILHYTLYSLIYILFFLNLENFIYWRETQLLNISYEGFTEMLNIKINFIFNLTNFNFNYTTNYYSLIFTGVDNLYQISGQTQPFKLLSNTFYTIQELNVYSILSNFSLKSIELSYNSIEYIVTINILSLVFFLRKIKIIF